MGKEGEGAEPSKVQKKAHAEPDAWQREQHEAHLRTLHALTHELKTGRETQEASDRGKTARENLTIFLLFVTVILTALTFVIFYKQLGEMRRATKGADQATLNADLSSFRALIRAHIDSDAAVKEAREDANNALKLARGTAAAQEHLTTDSNGINREALQAVQRAFVTVSGLRVEASKGFDITPDGKRSVIDYWNFTPEIENTGTTPTKNMVVRALGGLDYFALNKYPIAMGGRAGFVWPAWTGVQDTPVDPTNPRFNNTKLLRTIIGGHGKMTPGGIGVTPQYLHDMTRNGRQLYIWGWATYHDVFQHTPEHIVKYCFVVTGLKDEALGGQPDYGRCPHWNCSDDECKADEAEFLKEAMGRPATPRPPPIEVKGAVTATTGTATPN